MTTQQMNRALHPDDVEFFDHIKRLTFMTAEHFGLKVIKVEPSRRPNDRFLGWCSNTGNIKIAVRPMRLGTWYEKRHRDEMILMTIAHELAHIKHFDHGRDHEKFTAQIYKFLMYRK